MLVEKANRDAVGITKQDVDLAISAGWSQEAVFDAITVCAMFRFFNTWTDALGARDGTASLHANSGKRLAEYGYVPSANA